MLLQCMGISRINIAMAEEACTSSQMQASHSEEAAISIKIGSKQECSLEAGGRHVHHPCQRGGYAANKPLPSAPATVMTHVRLGPAARHWHPIAASRYHRQQLM